MNKVLFIICDGLSDRPIYQLGGKTPLEAADIKNINKITKRGVTGLMHTVDVGVRPGSDVAHLSLFGYDIDKYYSGRGPFEAVGYGMKLEVGDIALRGNFATIDKTGLVLDRRAGRIKDTRKLINSLKNLTIDGVQIHFKRGIGYRLVVVLKGKGLSNKISDVDPHEINKKVLTSKATKSDKQAKKTAKIINKMVKKVHEILQSHEVNIKRSKAKLPPANIILVRGAGISNKIPSFENVYGLKAACIAGGGLYKGIGEFLGMTIIPLTNATGKSDTNLSQKIKKAMSLLHKYDFIFVHIKATDTFAEDGDYMGKKKFIEKIDKALAPITGRDDILFVLTADHTTSSHLKIHTADPVPLLIAGNHIHTDMVETFGERSVISGKLGHIKGINLMPIIIDFLGKAPLKGA